MQKGQCFRCTEASAGTTEVIEEGLGGLDRECPIGRILVPRLFLDVVNAQADALTSWSIVRVKGPEISEFIHMASRTHKSEEVSTGHHITHTTE